MHQSPKQPTHDAFPELDAAGHRLRAQSPNHHGDLDSLLRRAATHQTRRRSAAAVVLVVVLLGVGIRTVTPGSRACAMAARSCRPRAPRQEPQPSVISPKPPNPDGPSIRRSLRPRTTPSSGPCTWSTTPTCGRYKLSGKS